MDRNFRNLDDLTNELLSEMLYGNTSKSVLTKDYFIDREASIMKIEIAVPGYRKEDLKIKIDSGWLILTAEVDKELKSHWRKSFTKRAYVGKEIAADSIKAKLENGIMQIELPKKDEFQPFDINID